MTKYDFAIGFNVVDLILGFGLLKRLKFEKKGQKFKWVYFYLPYWLMFMRHRLKWKFHKIKHVSHKYDSFKNATKPEFSGRNCQIFVKSGIDHKLFVGFSVSILVCLSRNDRKL